MPEEKKRIKGLASTIVFGILLTAALIFVLILIPIDVKKMVNDVASGSSSISDSASSMSGSSSGTEVGNAVGRSIGAAAAAVILVVLSILLIGGTGVPAIISLPFSIRNVKAADTKAIKIINIVYLAIAGSILIIDIIKFIQLIFIK